MTPMETAADAVAAKLTGKPKGFKFDPMIFVTIISVLMDVFSNCTNKNSPQEVAKLGKRMGPFQQAAILRHCRHNCTSSSEARDMLHAIMAAADEADEEEIMACCQESARLM